MKKIKNKNFLLLKHCGALTSKPYAFLIRPWEHFYKSTLDFTDGIGQPLQANIVSNSVVRVLPDWIKTDESTPWVSDKTRFSYEGVLPAKFINYLFSSKLENYNTDNKTGILVNRKKRFIAPVQKLVLLIYLNDHLDCHFKKINFFIIVFSNNLSLEILSLLVTHFKKYSFIKLKTNEVTFTDNYLETSFQLNLPSKEFSHVVKADLCFLVGVNTRYESSYLNLKLRKSFLLNNLLLVTLGSLLDLTFSVLMLGSTFKTFKKLTEGNSLMTQSFKNARHPVAILNSEFFKRQDGKTFFTFIELLKQHTYLNTRNWIGFNVLNPVLNDTGVISLYSFSSLSPTDLVNFSVFYFIDMPHYSPSIKKILSLKTLNIIKLILRRKEYYLTLRERCKNIVYQNNLDENKFWLDSKLKTCFSRAFTFKNNKTLLTNGFYNSCETYINTEGVIRKTINVLLNNNHNLKDKWRTLRKIFRVAKKQVFFLQGKNENNRLLSFKSTKFNLFKQFAAFQLYPTKMFTNLAFYNFPNSNSFLLLKKQVFFLQKIFDTKINYWIEDFYLGGKDLYSRYSATLRKCSQCLRLEKQNFFNYSFDHFIIGGKVFLDNYYSKKITLSYEGETKKNPEDPEKETKKNPEDPEKETKKNPEDPEKETKKNPEDPEKETKKNPEDPDFFLALDRLIDLVKLPANSSVVTNKPRRPLNRRPKRPKPEKASRYDLPPVLPPVLPLVFPLLLPPVLPPVAGSVSGRPKASRPSRPLPPLDYTCLCNREIWLKKNPEGGEKPWKEEVTFKSRSWWQARYPGKSWRVWVPKYKAAREAALKAIKACPCCPHCKNCPRPRKGYRGNWETCKNCPYQKK